MSSKHVNETHFNKVVSEWIDDNAWPRATAAGSSLADGEKGILIVTRIIPEDQSVFEFQSALDHFEVSAVYRGKENSLSALRISLVVPGYHKETSLTEDSFYHLSTNDGKDLPVNIGDGIISGNFSFKYVGEGAHRSIGMKYKVKLPFTGPHPVEAIISVCPSELAPYFSKEKLKAIPPFTPSELQQLETEKALAFSAGSETDVGAVPIRSFAPGTEHHLLVKFLNDFTKDGDKIVIETYYDRSVGKVQGGVSDIQASNGSGQYQVSVSFLGIFDVAGSVDPATRTITGGLYVRVPFAGRTRIARIQGALGSAEGVKAEVDAVIAKGGAMLTDKRIGGKRDLFIQLTLSLKFKGDIKSGKYRLLTLPF